MFTESTNAAKGRRSLAAEAIQPVPDAATHDGKGLGKAADEANQSVPDPSPDAEAGQIVRAKIRPAI